MMMLDSNKQKMYYALQIGEVPVYQKDDDGNTIYYTDSEGNKIPLETGEYRIGYGKPVEFFGNIAMSGGESEAVEFGLNLGDYSSVLITDKDYIPLNETSQIWHTTEPVMNDDGTVDEFTADYTIVKLSPSLNVDKYVLKKVVK